MDSPQEKANLPDDSLVLTLPDESSSLRDIALWAGMLVLLGLVAFWPATEGQFIWMDVRNLQPTELSTIWTGRWKDAQHYPMLQYHPVTYTTHWIEGHLVGRDATGAPLAFPFHLVNILLHCGSAVLAWLILRKLKLRGAWMAAALFALHPMNAETVSWISQRASVLAGVLFLGSIYSYLFFADDDVAMAPDQRWSLYGLSLVLFALAMLSKSTAWAMPVCVGLLLWWQRRLSLRHAALLFPFLLIGVVLGLAAADYERGVQGAVGPEWDWNFAQRMVLVGQTLSFYLVKLIAPVRLSAVYGRWPISVVSLWPLLVVAGGLAAAVWRFGRGPIVAAGCFVACLLPVMGFFNLVPMRYSFAADHNAYLAILPFVALVVAGATQLLRVAMRGTSYGGTVVGLSAVLLVAAGSMTWARTQVFQNSVVLWQDAVAKNSNSWFARARLSAALRDQADADLAGGDKKSSDQDLVQAVEQARAAAVLNPPDASIQLTWGGILVRQKDLAGAVDHLKQATQIEPNSVEAQIELASALISLKKYDEAVGPLDVALRVDSHSSSVHRMLGEAYAGMGDSKRAQAEYEAAIALDPQNYRAHSQLANLLAQAGDVHGAMIQTVIVAGLRPNDPEVWNALGVLSARTGKMTEIELSVQFFKKAVDLDPTYAEAKKNLDMALGMIAHQKEKAATQATTNSAK